MRIDKQAELIKWRCSNGSSSLPKSTVHAGNADSGFLADSSFSISCTSSLFANYCLLLRFGNCGMAFLWFFVVGGFLLNVCQTKF